MRFVLPQFQRTEEVVVILGLSISSTPITPFFILLYPTSLKLPVDRTRSPIELSPVLLPNQPLRLHSTSLHLTPASSRQKTTFLFLVDGRRRPFEPSPVLLPNHPLCLHPTSLHLTPAFSRRKTTFLIPPPPLVD